AATKKAQQLMLMQYEFLQQEENLELASARNITQRALVIGGGAAGMSAALGLANLGIGVDLIEKTVQLGGRLEKIYFSPHAEDPQQLLRELRSAAESNELIKIHFQTQLQQVSGEAGAFSVLLKNSEPEPAEQLYGAIIVATGGQEHIPTSYEHGKSSQILTQQQFKEKVVAGEIDMAQLKQVVMIQCVESRDEKRPYCSRICCTQAITNALKIKEANPAAEVVIFNRDIMTYGFREQYYTKLREMGGFFIRYEPGREPQVTVENGKITITAIEPVLNQEIVLQPDLLLLSTGIEPSDNSQLAELLNVKLDADNFFQEAEVKFRPVDFHRDGIYLAGLAHSPRFLEETITQGYAAAVRAASLLTKEKLTTSPLIAEVNPRRCSGCQMCIPSCVYNARVWDEETHTVLVREALCQGCGACAMVCPNNACKLKGYRDKQVMSVIDTVFSLM
ncbi:FAD-dependent oxidoreductase, partial [candidate division KSB1 bacterium]|nr:FAD-dependent oxidoreductase [candidate division KSB1 bacterium]